MPFFFDRLYRRLGQSYFLLYALFDLLSTAAICAATIGLLSLYQDMSATQFWHVLVVAELASLAGVSYAFWNGRAVVKPIVEWMQRGAGEKGAIEAWRAAVEAPREIIVRNSWQPFVLVSAPAAAYITLELELPFYSALFLFAGALVAVAYAAVLHLFASELALRPVLRDIVAVLPPSFDGRATGVPVRWKLLGALPIINIITGVVVSGLSGGGSHSLQDLGVDVVVAVLVAFTISLELTLLLSKSIVEPIDQLLEATERVKRGDLTTEVPVTSADEIGTLAASFNEMMAGLSEREALREAFGSYVDPEVTERVLREGKLIEGEEVEVSVLFVDIRDFTAFAEHASAREVVAHLNEFFGLVVPILLKHGGHANKFVGDGLLGVFGTPERHSDHADRALTAACEIAREVERKFDERLQIGAGVNSGPVMVGSIGGGGRLEFTVIGDPVNVAARVEAMTRETGDAVLITEATRCLLEHSDVELEPRGAIPLKGKSEPVPVYAAGLPAAPTRAAVDVGVRSAEAPAG